jgi:hypothetical protein
MTEEKPSVEEWWAGMIDDLIWRSIEEDEHLAWYGQVEAGFPKKEDIMNANLEKIMEKLLPVIREHIGKIIGDFDGMDRFGWTGRRD